MLDGRSRGLEIESDVSIIVVTIFGMWKCSATFNESLDKIGRLV
jgi:hypothetical protein